MQKKQRMTAFDGAKRKGYNARLRGVPNKENPYTWNGTVFSNGTGPRAWGTLFCNAWDEGWYECAEGKPLTSFDGLGILRSTLDKFKDE